MSDIITIGDVSFETKVALTEEERAKGLMFQEWPPPVMVFPYKTATYNKFWMKNTISPLDIIFCRDGKIVDIKKGEPLSLQSVGPDIPTDFIIELPYGHVKKFGIKVGNSIRMNYSIATLAKTFNL